MSESKDGQHASEKLRYAMMQRKSDQSVRFGRNPLGIEADLFVRLVA
jgi:hypothetical protein